MPQISLKVSSNAKLVAKRFENLRKSIPQIGKSRMQEAAREIQRRLRIPGKSPTYPINWDSDRQRIAFFASNGFGGGIPHIRTGQSALGWKIVPLPNGYRIENNKKSRKIAKVRGSGKPFAVYIWGDARGMGQSNIHKGRWPLFRDIVDAVVRRLPKSVRESLVSLVKRRK